MRYLNKQGVLTRFANGEHDSPYRSSFFSSIFEGKRISTNQKVAFFFNFEKNLILNRKFRSLIDTG
jgi:hypothetical protein